ncbi:helix-turn-helix domain-containing protein [Rhodobacteraceae bacterium 2CG4]|uniref:Helix-turn-helix domain-containing protein n=1 Tax=Halovulum marinum TaxID=2662447 RepID=A0A6L5Z2R1_9RHOB|nr:IclR family transcriptional regulator [Halovulum marinum]MSU90856.1 helix-turn-helix domain-containing protein [Halovulum marinum]
MTVTKTTKSAAAEPRSVKSAERVLDILELAIAKDHGVSFMELTAALSIPKSSLHALLDVMVRRQYLEPMSDTRRYTLGIRTLEAGEAYMRTHDMIDVARQAMQALVAEVNETTQLARLSGRENVYLARVDSSHALRLLSETGRRLQAHATGVGKALLAQMPEDQVQALYDEPELPVYTGTTIATPEALSEELERTRRRGFAIDNQEYTPGVFCLAVPVFGQRGTAEVSLSVSVPLTRVSKSALTQILARLASTSLEISRRTGNPADNTKLVALSDPDMAAAQIEALAASPHYGLSLS